MKKLFKTLALIGVALCLSLGVLAFAACTENEGEIPEDGKVTYTITVNCSDSASITNFLYVQLRDDQGEAVADGEIVKTSSAATSGKATITVDEGTYKVFIMEKEGFEGSLAAEELIYSVPTVTKDNPSVTIEIGYDDSDDNVSVTVTFIHDGAAVANASVSLCGGNGDTFACYYKMTDANGVAVFSLPAGEYEVHVGDDVVDTVTVAEEASITVEF